eukprot:2742342-Rhodomonas_salina.2
MPGNLLSAPNGFVQKRQQGERGGASGVRREAVQLRCKIIRWEEEAWHDRKPTQHFKMSKQTEPASIPAAKTWAIAAEMVTGASVQLLYHMFWMVTGPGSYFITTASRSVHIAAISAEATIPSTGQYPGYQRPRGLRPVESHAQVQPAALAGTTRTTSRSFSTP